MRRFATVFLSLLCAILLRTGTADAQYFGQNKVNYTSFDWSYIPTKNFDVYYSDGGYEIALIAAHIAENSFSSLAAHWDYTPRKRIPILVYNSHNDFAQTNVITGEIIEEGVGGFTELFKNRVVVPWEGSLDKFEHVIHHELTHALMFDMLYGGVMESIVSREYTFQLPLWFAEGLAEHESQYWSTEADMVVRDGITSGYIPQIQNIYGGYLAYKGGESFFKFLQEQYGGRHKWIAGELLQSLSRTKNVDRTFKAVLGKDTETLSKEWHRKLRTDHWPEVAGRELGEDFATRLTDHEKEQNYLNTSPSFNPTGDKIAFLSDRNGFKEILLMRAADGKIIETLVKGEKADEYEEMHWLRSSITWSPDGTMIAFSSKAGKRDAIHIIRVGDGGFSKEITPEMEGVFSPAWSPDGTRILFCGIKDTKPDLFTVNVATGEIVRLTDDYFTETDPAWSRDGKHIAFSSDRRDAPYGITLDDISSDYALFTMDADGTNIRRICPGFRDARHPSWSPDGKYITFVSDRNGINNLYAVNLADSTEIPLTNLLTAASAPVWSPDGNSIAFTSFREGGWDIFVLKRPLRRELKMESLTPTAYLRTETAPSDSTVHALPQPEIILRDSGTGQELSLDRADSKRYTLKFSPDMVSAFASYNTFYGVGGLGQVVFSDIMGDHRVGVGAQLVYSLEESNLEFSYMYLKRRTNLGINLFHYKTYYYSSDWDIFGDEVYGGSLIASRPFSRFKRMDFAVNYLALNRDRYDYYGYDYSTGLPSTSGEIHLEGVRSITLETNFVHDNTLWSYTGPANGSRYLLNVEHSPKLSATDLEYTTVAFDYRKYTRIGRRNSLVARFSGGASFGRDPRMFFLGGDTGWLNARSATLDSAIESNRDIYFARVVYPLRGFRWYEFYGRKYFLTNFEFRFPFVDYLLVSWPFRFAIGNIGGVVFTDIGSAWDKLTSDGTYDTSFHGGGQAENGNLRLDDIKMSIGTGVRLNLGFAVLRMDTAWQTTLDDTKPSPMFSVSVGPNF